MHLCIASLHSLAFNLLAHILPCFHPKLCWISPNSAFDFHYIMVLIVCDGIHQISVSLARVFPHTKCTHTPSMCKVQANVDKKWKPRSTSIDYVTDFYHKLCVHPSANFHDFLLVSNSNDHVFYEKRESTLLIGIPIRISTPFRVGWLRCDRAMPTHKTMARTYLEQRQ